MTIKGLMLHSTGANNPNISRYVPLEVVKSNNWNVFRPGGRQVCVHGFIGKLENGDIATVQTLPWNMKGWHAGGTANNNYIGVEICEDGLDDKDYFDKVYKEAVELYAYLCKEYNLTEKNIICHSEGYKKGIASNHSDVMHWFPKHGKSMDTFRTDVKALLSGNLQKKEEFEMAKVYKNGSTSEPVFADTSLKLKTGSLDAREVCECLAIVNGVYLVKYKVNGTTAFKTGFVKYSGGVK